MKNKKTLKHLSNAYIYHKRLIEKYEREFERVRPDVLDSAFKIVGKIEYAVSQFPEKDKKILENDVLAGKFRVCENEYMSRASYYRIRESLYSDYLKLIV